MIGAETFPPNKFVLPAATLELTKSPARISGPDGWGPACSGIAFVSRTVAMTSILLTKACRMWLMVSPTATNRTSNPAKDHPNISVSYTHLRAHETRHDLVCRLLL